MNTFLILINLANPAKAGEVADYYRTVPDLAGWKGKVCIQEVCQDVDRSREFVKPYIPTKPLIKQPEGTTPEVEVQPDGSKVLPIEAPKDPIDKVFKGLKGLMDKDAEFNIKVDVEHTKAADGSESTHVQVEVGGKLGSGN